MAPKSLRSLPRTWSKSVGNKTKAAKQSVFGIFGGKDSRERGSLVPPVPLPPAPAHGILINGNNYVGNQISLSSNATVRADDSLLPESERNNVHRPTDAGIAEPIVAALTESQVPISSNVIGVDDFEHGEPGPISSEICHIANGTDAAETPSNRSGPQTRLTSDATAVDTVEEIQPAPAAVRKSSQIVGGDVSDGVRYTQENYKQDRPCKSGHSVYMADTLMFYYFWEHLRWYHQYPSRNLVGSEAQIISSNELMQKMNLSKDRISFSDEQIDLALRREAQSFLYRDDHGSWLTQRRCDLLNYINRLTIVGGVLTFPPVPSHFSYEVIARNYLGNIGTFLSKIPHDGGPFNGLHNYKKCPDGRSGINPFKRRLQHCVLPVFRSENKITTPIWHFEHKKRERLAYSHQKADFAVYCFRDSDPETHPRGNSRQPKSTDRFRVVAAIFGGGEGDSATVRGESQINADLPPTLTIEAAIPRHYYDANIITKRSTLSLKPWAPSALDAMLALKEASLQWNASGQAFNLDTVGKFPSIQAGETGFPGDFTAEEITYALNYSQRGKDMEKIFHDHQADCTGFKLLRSRMRPIVDAAGQIMAGVDEQQASQSTELLTEERLREHQKQLSKATANGQGSLGVVKAAMNLPPASTGAQTLPAAGDKNDMVDLEGRPRRLRNMFSRAGRRASSAH